MNLDEFINWSIKELKSNSGDQCFYDRAENSLHKWAKKLQKVDSFELLDCIRNQLSNVNSERSFNNLITKRGENVKFRPFLCYFYLKSFF